VQIESQDMQRSKTSITLLVVFFVILLYSLVPPAGSGSYFAPVTQYHYQLLTKGFLLGHLSLPVVPQQGLINLSNPYDPLQNFSYREMFDASYYKGKYFLYFGPLPLVYFMPYYLITGKIATSHAAVLFFLSLGFGIGFYLLLKIKFKYFPQISQPQLILAGLVLGLCNNALFLLARTSVYEVAIASAFCLMNLALFFLYNMFSNNFKVKDVCLFSICLGLCVAGRPNFTLVCLIAIPIVFVFFLKLTPKKDLFKLGIALVGPIFLIGMVLALYNYIRFDSFFEFGMHYEIADDNRITSHEMKMNPYNWLTGLHYYFFSKFSSGPWASISPTDLKFKKFWMMLPIQNVRDYSLGYVSVFTTVPVCLFLFALPLVYIKNKDSNRLPLWRFTGLTFLAVGIIILYTTSLGLANQRYITDFLPYLLFLAIIGGWNMEQNISNPGGKKLIQISFILVELASIFYSFNV
jgi:hypothetical protein